MNADQLNAAAEVTRLVDVLGEKIPDTQPTTDARAALLQVRSDLETARGVLAGIVADTTTAPAELVDDRNAAEASVRILSERADTAIFTLSQCRLADARKAEDTAHDDMSAKAAAMSAQWDADIATLSAMFGGAVEARFALEAARGSGYPTAAYQNANIALLQSSNQYERAHRLIRLDLQYLIPAAGLN